MTSTVDNPPQRRARTKAVLTVRSREQITPNMVRLVVGGPGFENFTDNEVTDKYVKISFVDADEHPVTRTYTVRRVESDAQQLTIDFVTHGDHGLAAPWARQAGPGDTITLSGAGGAYRPDTAKDWHLFVGDESALPAIASALEALPADARGIAYLETCDPDEFLDAELPAGVRVQWLHRDEPGTRPELLAGAVLAGEWPEGSVHVFAHGERESMKAVRAALKERLGEHDTLSLSGYWAHGRTEDRFQAEKREPIGQLG